MKALTLALALTTATLFGAATAPDYPTETIKSEYFADDGMSMGINGYSYISYADAENKIEAKKGKGSWVCISIKRWRNGAKYCVRKVFKQLK